jgi:hypothetical protein
MRYKVIPEPRGLDALRTASDALPLVPGSVEDCCTRIRDRTALGSRDAARELLTFLEALGLAAETDRGYHRVRDPPDDETLAANFEARVFGAEEVLAALAEADGALTADEAFESVRGTVPRWERSRHADWEAEWTQRVAWLLEWAETFGLAESGEDGYRPAGN